MEKILTIILSTLVVVTSYTQTIEYDFKTRNGKKLNRQVTSASPVQDGSFLIFKVKNINTFRYKVTITGENYDFATAIPSELQALFRLSNNELEEDIQNTESVVGELGGAINAMQEIGNEAKGNSDMSNMDAVFPNLISICNDYQDKLKLLSKYKYDRLELVKLSKMRWDDYKALETAINTKISIPQIQIDNFDQFYSDLFCLYEKAENQYEKASDAATKDISASTTAGNAALALELTKKKAIIDKKLKSIQDNWDLVADDDIIKLLQDLSILLSALNQKTNFIVFSAPIQADGDVIDFTVKIEPVKVSDLLPFETSYEFPVTVRTKGGWRADFSVGPTLSFGDEAMDEEYFLNKTSPTDATGILTASVQDEAKPGLAAMLHAYKRSGTQFNYGLMMGLGVGFESIDDSDLSLYSGLSAILGKRQKIILSGGLSFHRVERLDPSFKLGATYDESSIDLSQVTNNYFLRSFFLSISYAIATRTISRR